jgi:hypothetical protein
LQTLVTQRGKKVKEIFRKIFKLKLDDVDGLKRYNLEEAKKIALASFKESLVISLHPTFRLLLIDKKQDASKIGSLLQLIICHNEEDFSQLNYGDDALKAFADLRRKLFQIWSNFIKDMVKGSLSEEQKVLQFLNYCQPSITDKETKVTKKVRIFAVDQLSIPGTTNTSLVPLILSFIDRGKILVM